MLDLHVAGGREKMQAAARAVVERAKTIGIERPRLIGVTVLTSLTQGDLRALGIGSGVEEQALTLTRLAKESGLDGVVASPHEVRAIRQRFGPDLLVVTPGIRPKAAQPDDQRRIATAREAIRAGADYVVVGRPILAAADPVQAAEQLIAEMETP
jgi:orotidine-5'-phosphate decarboxylase